MTLPSPPAAGQGVTISGPLRFTNRSTAAWVHLPLKIEVCRGGGNPACPAGSRTAMQSRGKKPKIKSTAGQAPPGRGVKVLFRDRIPRHLPGNSRANRLSLFGRLARGDPRWPAAPLPVCRPPHQQTIWSGTPPRQPDLRHCLRTGQAPEHDFRHRFTIAERQKFQAAAKILRKLQLYRHECTIEVCR